MLWKGWKSQACGLAIMAASILMLNMQTMDSDAGLFRRLFRQNNAYCGGGGNLQNAYASCGGMQSAGAYSGCGGAGLQAAMAYSSCNGMGGGGGGNLQFAPTVQYYQPAPVQYYAPAYQGYDSSCPGGMCPPGSVGGGLPYSAPPVSYYRQATYAISRPAIPAGIRLNAGERYVAGSLRMVPNAPAVAKATHKKENFSIAMQKGVSLYQISRSDCINCKKDAKIVKASGVDLKVVEIDKDPETVVELWRTSDIPIQGYPSYVLVENGKAVRFSDKPMGNADKVARMVDTSTLGVALAAVESAPKAKEKDELKDLMLVMIEEQRKTNKVLQGIGDVSKR